MVFSQDGIFSRAEQATDKYGQAKARETLELCLGEAQMKKYESGLTEAQLDEEIAKVGSLLPKEDETSNNQLVIVEGHIFEIDRSVPKIIDYKGPANGVIVTYKITQNGWTDSTASATVTGAITKYGGGTVTSVTGTKAEVVNGVAGTPTTIIGLPTTGGEYTISDITTDTDITITTTDSEGKTATKEIKVRLVRDNTPPEIKTVEVSALGLKIKMKATAIDDISRLKSLKYSITPNTGIPTGQNEGELTSGEEKEITATEANEEYTITIIAEDNAGNKSAPQSKKVKTGVIKHINTTSGLKAINASEIYGATVNGYACDRTDVSWQIFYIDERDNNRVYLIAKDYVVPPTNSTTAIPKLLEGGSSIYPKTYRFQTTDSSQTVLGNFNGTLATSPTIYNKFINDYLKEYKSLNASSSNPNLQATKLMLEQTYWKEYNGAKADLAFGGPTLPLFQASYNDTCKNATRLGIQQSGTGYLINKGGGNFCNGESSYGFVNNRYDVYFRTSSGVSGAAGMWVASPCAQACSVVFMAYCNGGLAFQPAYMYTDCCCFRPIVSLQSNTQFTDNSDGSYTIVN